MLFILFLKCTVRNVRKFSKFLCYKGNVKFDDIYDFFENKYILKLSQMF